MVWGKTKNPTTCDILDSTWRPIIQADGSPNRGVPQGCLRMRLVRI
jgi:hypothetical protein